MTNTTETKAQTALNDVGRCRDAYDAVVEKVRAGTETRNNMEADFASYEAACKRVLHELGFTQRDAAVQFFTDADFKGVKAGIAGGVMHKLAYDELTPRGIGDLRKKLGLQKTTAPFVAGPELVSAEISNSSTALGALSKDTARIKEPTPGTPSTSAFIG